MTKTILNSHLLNGHLLNRRALTIKAIVTLLAYLFCASAYSFDQAKLNQYLETLETHDKAMLSLAIVKDGQPIYQKAIGYADVENATKANKDTQYAVGSITKVFTATMIFQLIDEGKLTLKTKLSEFYPKVRNAKKITISMLLSHQSGLHDYLDTPEYQQFKSERKTRTEMIKLMESMGSDFKPSRKTHYSNTGYTLLGFILEDISNDSYANQLQKRITDKLKLSNTFYGNALPKNNQLAKSYHNRNNTWLVTEATDMSIPLAAGAIVSTPTDVATFLEKLLSGELISAKSLANMQAFRLGIGRGLFQFPFMEKTAQGHAGRLDDFTSQAGYFQQDDVAFALTCNGNNYPLNDISIAVLSIYFDLPYDIPNFDLPTLAMSPKALSQYEGVFSSKTLPMKLTLKLVGKQLTGQATGQAAFDLTPVSTTEFRYDAWGIKLLFTKDGGKVDYSRFVLEQGGQRYRFTKD